MKAQLTDSITRIVVPSLGCLLISISLAGFGIAAASRHVSFAEKSLRGGECCSEQGCVTGGFSCVAHAAGNKHVGSCQGMTFDDDDCGVFQNPNGGFCSVLCVDQCNEAPGYTCTAGPGPGPCENAPPGSIGTKCLSGTHYKCMDVEGGGKKCLEDPDHPAECGNRSFCGQCA